MAPGGARGFVRTAVVHDWLDTCGGAEQVLEQMLVCYPDADVFALVDFLPEADRGILRGCKVTTSFIQNLPGAQTYFRYYLPLMPWAMSRLDLSGYDLVLSSSWAFAKAAKTAATQVHVSYIHTPIRYAWELRDTYLQRGLASSVMRWAARHLLDRLRRWDINTAQQGGQLIANSRFIAERIRRCWQRDSIVLNPPVAVGDFVCGDRLSERDDFFVVVSRLVHYKAVDRLVEAFNQMPEKRLVIIGDGPMYAALKNTAGPNIDLLGSQPRPVVIDNLCRAKAFVFCALEDFGIALVEAQACGTPVIAYGAGGALDSVIPYGQAHATGLFFSEQSASSIIAAVEEFERLTPGVLAADCVANAQRFAPRFFREALIDIIDQVMRNKQTEMR